MRRTPSLLAVLAVLALACPSRAAEKDRALEADRLIQKADQRWAQGTPAERRKALDALEEAAKLTPRDPRVLSHLAHAYLDTGYDHDAKEMFEHVTELTPRDADAWEGLGLVWKRNWLATLVPSSLDQALRYFEQAVRVDAARERSWTMLALLRAERGDAAGAQQAAVAGLGAAPESTDAALAGAYLAYRAGRLVTAESLFTVAIARLPRSLALRFREVTPLVPESEREELARLTPAEHAEHVRRFWSASDPDPTTRVNEARLEYWARVAHASLLYSDTWNPTWDMRAELYMRYGAPASVAYQPPGIPLAQQPNQSGELVEGTVSSTYLSLGGRSSVKVPQGWRFAGEPFPMMYPLHAQVWSYPDLGMLVVLKDPSISQHYELPRDPSVEIDPVPDPRLLARSGLVATAENRAVFAPLPPGEHPLPIEAVVSAFEGEQGPHLLANVAVPGEPGRALHAECVVLDSTEHEVGRMARDLGASRCDAATTRAGDFAFDLPPGRYRVAVSVVDGEGGRGVARERHELSPKPGALALSDILLVCGPVETVPVGGSVRLDPNLGRRITGDEPLLAYFEAYELRPDAHGTTKFEYDYAVRSLDRDPRPWFKRLFGRSPGDRISVHTTESGVGPTRRQYLNVPAQSLPPGHYRLEVTVRDHGATAHGSIDFSKEG